MRTDGADIFLYEKARIDERAKICEALRKWAFQSSKEADHDALYAAAVMLEHNCDDDDWEPAPT